MRLALVAEKITDCLVKQGLVESDQSEVYVYGMTLMISSTATLQAVHLSEINILLLSAAVGLL